MATTCDFDALAALLKASSKEDVLKISNEAFLQRDKKPEHGTENVLSLEPDQYCKLLASLGEVIKAAIFHGYTEAADLQSLFPKNFHKNLRDLLVKIMMENMNNWRNQALTSSVSLPRLVDFDWRVDIKTASDAITRMSVPTCVLQMKVQENATTVDSASETSYVNVELSKETLDTMLDGFSKIRDQLSSVAQR